MGVTIRIVVGGEAGRWWWHPESDPVPRPIPAAELTGMLDGTRRVEGRVLGVGDTLVVAPVGKAARAFCHDAARGRADGVIVRVEPARTRPDVRLLGIEPQLRSTGWRSAQPRRNGPRPDEDGLESFYGKDDPEPPEDRPERPESFSVPDDPADAFLGGGLESFSPPGSGSSPPVTRPRHA